MTETDGGMWEIQKRRHSADSKKRNRRSFKTKMLPSFFIVWRKPGDGVAERDGPTDGPSVSTTGRRDSASQLGRPAL